MLLQDMGRLQDAEPLLRESLAISRKALGEEHADVGTSLNNLGLLLQDMGRFEDAEPLYRGSLEIWRKTLGEEHQNVGQSLNNLGSLMKAMGRLHDAEPLYRKSLEIRRKALGSEHPDVTEDRSQTPFVSSVQRYYILPVLPVHCDRRWRLNCFHRGNVPRTHQRGTWDHELMKAFEAHSLLKGVKTCYPKCKIEKSCDNHG